MQVCGFISGKLLFTSSFLSCNFNIGLTVVLHTCIFYNSLWKAFEVMFYFELVERV